MSALNEAQADFLVKLADYVDELEAENQRLAAAQQSDHSARVESDAEKFAALVTDATGEELDMGLARKIAAHSDDDVRQLLQKLASPDVADSMGASQRSRSKVASSGDEAWDQFGTFLLED